LNVWNAPPPAGKVIAADAEGFTFGPRQNDTFIAVNRLLKTNEDVWRLPSGAFYVRAKPGTATAIRNIANQTGVSFIGLGPALAGATKLRTPRVGLWDTYGGSMPSGWTRWILEQFEFPYERVFAPQLDAGNLNAKYDVLVFVTGAIPGAAGGRGGRGGGNDEMPSNLPAEYRDQYGRMTVDKTLPKIREFIENGGTVLAIGSSATNLAAFLRLPIESQLVEGGAPLPRTKFYVPGSVLATKVDVGNPVAYGMTEKTDVFFDDSPVFKLSPNATNIKVIATYDGKTPLRSGWAWGQSYLENGVAAAEASLGKGRVLLFGPEILMRAQPHGTFKYLFNGIYSSLPRSGPAVP
jgi:hypothetical protein